MVVVSLSTLITDAKHESTMNDTRSNISHLNRLPLLVNTKSPLPSLPPPPLPGAHGSGLRFVVIRQVLTISSPVESCIAPAFTHPSAPHVTEQCGIL